MLTSGRAPVNPETWVLGERPVLVGNPIQISPASVGVSHGKGCQSVAKFSRIDAALAAHISCTTAARTARRHCCRPSECLGNAAGRKWPLRKSAFVSTGCDHRIGTHWKADAMSLQQVRRQVSHVPQVLVLDGRNIHRRRKQQRPARQVSLLSAMLLALGGDGFCAHVMLLAYQVAGRGRPAPFPRGRFRFRRR